MHDNNAVPKVFKFQHLRNSLKGWAASALGDWQQTEDSYEEAWDRLNQLFNRPYQTSTELLNKFNALPKLEKPSGGMLQKFSNTTHEVIRQLRALNFPVEHFDLFIVHGIHSKLDPETSRRWELSRTSEKPTMAELLDFLDRQAKALFGTQFMAFGKPKDSRKRPFDDKEQSTSKKPRSDQTPSGSGEQKGDTNKTAPLKCVLCKESHPLYKCANSLKMKLNDRKKLVYEKKLCRNCFGSTHFEKDCKLNECFRCNLKHNSLICKENPRNAQQVVANVNQRPPGAKELNHKVDKGKKV